jgi:3-oxoacyl-[acyl-carrier-protein] synthase-3
MLKNLTTYLPEGRLTNDELAMGFGNWTAEKIFAKTGIRERRIAGQHECASDMAFRAGADLLEGKDRQCFDFIIFCSQTPDYLLPTTACILQRRLGLGTGCGAIDLPVGCSGYIYGLALAHALLLAGTATNLILLTADTYSKLIAEGDKSTRTLFGDAATATWLTKDSSRRLSSFVLGSDGGGADDLIVKSGGARHGAENGKPPTLFMNGPEIFNFTVRIVPGLVRDVLNKARLQPDEIDYYVFHQANAFLLEHLRVKLNIPREKFPMHLEECGNTVSSTIPLTLADLDRSGRLQPGMKIVLIGFGVGLSWGGCLLKW